MKEIKYNVNKQIRARSVMVVSPKGDQLGIMPLEKALERADEDGLDLVEVSPNSTPPVCRIMNYGKFLYEQKKKQKEIDKNQHKPTVKEIRLRPNTGDHDIEIKAKKAREFLSHGDKVKLNVIFKGRENAHTDLGKSVLDKFYSLVKDISDIEVPPSLDGKRYSMVLESKR